MTRPTVPAVSAEAQAARGWPRPGTRVRVTRTHTSGLVETTEGVAADGDWDEDRTTYWQLLNEGAGEVALTSDDVWTVTWEELEPVPSRGGPPRLEPGPYLDRDGEFCVADEEGWLSYIGSEDTVSPAVAAASGPYVVLRPVSEVVDRADAQELAAKARDWAVYLCNHEHINHQETAEADFEACNQDECPERRALLARVDAPGATA